MRWPPFSLLLSLLAVLALGCNDARTDMPRDFLRLAGEGAPEARRTVEAALVDVQPAIDGWLRVRQTIAPEDWSPWTWPGVHSTSLRLPSSGAAPRPGGGHELRLGERELEQRDFAAGLSAGNLEAAGFSDGDYLVLGDVLLCFDRGGSFVGQPLDYYAWIERDLRPEGRVHIPGVTGTGHLLLPGERLALDLPALELPAGADELGAQAQLLFTAFVHGGAQTGATTTLVVEQDGQQLLEAALPNRRIARGEVLRVDLPRTTGGELAFRVTAGDGLVLLLDPVVLPIDAVGRALHASARGPLDPSAEGAADALRPPDIVLFLADTFRADNLALWGGDPDLAPHMNAFAAESLAFVGARAPSSWTLPSQASMLSGVYPYQHQITEGSVAMPRQLPTIARVLSAAGYRTVAVTDGALVSELYGFDHGFDAFLEEHRSKDFEVATLDRLRRVLAADDGRPLFLFVQSYRTHSPYTAGPATLDSHPELFGPDPDPADWRYADLVAKWQAAFAQRDAGGAEQLARIGERMRRLYLGGVAELDDGFARFLETLAAAGLDQAYLLLTSDHGEAFGEHGNWDHSNSVYEEQVRVPFLLRGPGLAPDVRGEPISLIDIPPTLAVLAGMPPEPDWIGHALLSGGQRTTGVFSFECNPTKNNDAPDDYAVYQGERKVIGRVEDRRAIRAVAHAFDLGIDGAELSDLGAAADWPAALLERWASDLDRATAPGLDPVQRSMTEEELVQLQALGYFGDLELDGR